MAKKTKNPTPQPQVREAEDKTGKADAVVLDLFKGRGSRASLWADPSLTIDDGAADKARIMSEARQRLAEARDYFDEADSAGSEMLEKAQSEASRGALALYQAGRSGSMSQEERSELLGDIFGRKTKKDGSPSKTPDGQGETLRKRINRMINAAEFADDQRGGGSYFDDFPDAADVAEIVSDMEVGNISIYTAYDNLTALKKAVRPAATPLQFDPARVLKLTEVLATAEAVETIADSTPLQMAYKGLLTQLLTLGERLAEELDPPIAG